MELEASELHYIVVHRAKKGAGFVVAYVPFETNSDINTNENRNKHN